MSFAATHLIGFGVGGASGVSVDQTAGQTFSEDNAGSGLSNLFDDSASSNWLSGAADFGYVQVQFSAAKYFTGYSITAVNSADYVRTPISWTLKGSNTGAFSGEETTLDSQTSVSAWAQAEKRTYTCSSPGSYSYLRFNYTAKTDPLGKGAEYEMAEMEMLGY